MGKVMQAIEGFACEIDGKTLIVNQELTRVDSEHELVKRYPQHFRPVEENLTYETEAATNNPGEKRARGRGAQKSSKSSQEAAEPSREPLEVPTPAPPEGAAQEAPDVPQAPSQAVQSSTPKEES